MWDSYSILLVHKYFCMFILTFVCYCKLKREIRYKCVLNNAVHIGSYAVKNTVIKRDFIDYKTWVCFYSTFCTQFDSTPSNSTFGVKLTPMANWYNGSILSVHNMHTCHKLIFYLVRLHSRHAYFNVLFFNNIICKSKTAVIDYCLNFI